MDRVESRLVGIEHLPSAVHDAFIDVVTQGTEAQLRPLLHHKNPAVRAYIGADWAAHHKDDLPALAPLLVDTTDLTETNADVTMASSVGAHVARALCRTVIDPATAATTVRVGRDLLHDMLKGDAESQAGAAWGLSWLSSTPNDEIVAFFKGAVRALEERLEASMQPEVARWAKEQRNRSDRR